MRKTSKHKRDIYYRQAKEAGYRARSAFKLMHLNDSFKLFEGVRKVVDLCAAPGSWSQVLAEHLKPLQNPDVKIVSVDIQAMSSLPGVTILRGDITKESTARAIIENFAGEKADLVVCDGAPDVTGFHDIDEFNQSDLLTCALNITTYLLKEEGVFVAKIFRGKDMSALYSQMKIFFPIISICKPQSSRNSSIEAFIVCQNYRPPEKYVPIIWKSIIVGDSYDFHEDKSHAEMIPFMLRSDLNNYDADTNDPIVGPDFSNYEYKNP